MNLKFCFEGMEESGSEGLDDLIKSEVKKGKEGWFDGVDCVCIVSEIFRSNHVQNLTYRFVLFSLIITGSTLAHLQLPMGSVEFLTSRYTSLDQGGTCIQAYSVGPYTNP